MTVVNQAEYDEGVPNGNVYANGNGHTEEKVVHSDGFATRAIHVGSEPDPVTGAVVPMLSTATTYAQHGIGKHKGFEYSRSANPTRSQLEALLASLETESGSASDQGSLDERGEGLVYASGSAATAAICTWATLQADEGGAGGSDGKTGGGGHVLAVNDVYGGTARFLSRAIRPTGLRVSFLDMDAAGEEGIRENIKEDTKIIWLEVPTNPLFLVPPLELISRVVASLPLESRPLIVVDTTFLSPFYCTPLIATSPDRPALADVVLTSLSKYSGGHSDIILGSLVVSAKTKRERPDLIKGLRFVQNAYGASASPRDCHLMIRSLKTLGVRTLRHGLNALRVAAWLESRNDVEKVRYPGLKGHKAFDTVEPLLAANARKELEYLGWEFPYRPGKTAGREGTLERTRSLGIPFGGMLGFEIKGATEEMTEKFLVKLRLIVLAESLGGVESLIEAPYGMTHASIPVATREAIGITPGLIRLSVGIEDVDDLIKDLDQAFDAIKP